MRGKFVPYVDLQLTYYFSAPFLAPILLLYLLIPSSDHPSLYLPFWSSYVFLMSLHFFHQPAPMYCLSSSVAVGKLKPTGQIVWLPIFVNKVLSECTPLPCCILPVAAFVLGKVEKSSRVEQLPQRLCYAELNLSLPWSLKERFANHWSKTFLRFLIF